jgi:hypothetical protein
MSEESRNRILLRRAKFIAAALAAATASSEACGGTVTADDAGSTDAAIDMGPAACLKMAVDSGPQPCLAPEPPDSGGDG